MKTTIRAVAIIAAIALVSGCAGSRRFDRRSSEIRLPTAPTLEPSPAVVDPTQTGAVGEPSPTPRTPFPDAIPLQQ